MSKDPLLCYRDLGDKSGPVLCLMHGLFGSSSNWMGIVRRLQNDYRIIVPDLRNHGRSPHRDEMNYPVMVEDLMQLLDTLELPSLSLLGHSMGGKVAMWAALTHPERIDRLVVADIAPVAYGNRFTSIFKGLDEMPLQQLQNREEADSHLSKSVVDRGVRQYLLQNLLKQEQDWVWRFNLQVLQSALPALSGFPVIGESVYPGDVLFIHGERSDYVNSDALKVIQHCFPHNRQRMIHGAGHWLYAEQPDQFAQAVSNFLK
ncbi:MAG: alpha/beta fold hydrolase [Candidatus Thiodiazotropha sp. 6PLUC2]